MLDEREPQRLSHREDRLVSAPEGPPEVVSQKLCERFGLTHHSDTGIWHLCSESIGSTLAPESAASFIMIGPAATNVSLLASATEIPRCRAAVVDGVLRFRL